MNTQIKKRLSEKISASVKNLSKEDQKNVFSVLLLGIYKKIPEHRSKTLVFVPAENNLLEMKLANGAHIFWLHKNEDEKDLITQALKVFSQNLSSQVPRRIHDCADVLLKKGMMFHQIELLFEHYLLNSLPFPWGVLPHNKGNLVTKDFNLILHSEDFRTIQLVCAISGGEIIKETPEKELLEEIRFGKISCTYCAELATTIEDGKPVCGIPGNHG